MKAQVEVYQSDFHAEREARERIAGEKADLIEEVKKLPKRVGGGGGGGRAGAEEHGRADLRDRINSLQAVERKPPPQVPTTIQQGNRRNFGYFYFLNYLS